MAPHPLPTPTPDELDDLIYAARTGDLAELTTLITTLCATHGCAPSVLLASSIDIDGEGLGSQSSLLHYPAANGNAAVVAHLLALLTPSDSLGASPAATTADKSAPQLVNHANVSGNTPLHWAAMNGHLDVVKALVAAGADARIRNAAGRDCIVEAEMAAEGGMNAEGARECVVWMLRHCEGVDSGVSDEGHAEGEEEVEEGEEKEKGRGGVDGNEDVNGDGMVGKEET